MDCSKEEDGPCNICGSADSKDHIGSCSKCGDRQHLWCMHPLLWTIPSTWFCHECQMLGISISPTQVRDGVCQPGLSTMPCEQSPSHQNMRMKDTRRSKVKFIPASEAALLSSDARNSRMPVQNSSRKRRQHHDKNTPSDLRISSPIKQSAPIRDFCQLTKALRENRELKGMGKKTADTVKTSTRQVSSSSPGDDGSSDKEIKRHEHESVDKVKPNELAIIEKLTKNPVKTDAIWSGQFEILNDPDHGVCSGLQVFTPCRIHRKAYFFTLGLPSLLSFKLISRKFAWDEIFKDNPPDEYDVALYMLPEISDRCRRSYKHLVDMMDSCDYAMVTYIDGVELVVFTSRWLETTCKEAEAKNFLWGLYRIRECIAINEEPSITVQPNVHEEKVVESNTAGIVNGEEGNEMNLDVVDMEVDVMDGEWITPQEALVSKERKPFEHEETRKRIKEEKLECPPGFESQHWWKMMKKA